MNVTGQGQPKHLNIQTHSQYYTIPKKGETAVHCCDPALSVLVTLVGRNVLHVVSALQSTVFTHLYAILCSLSLKIIVFTMETPCWSPSEGPSENTTLIWSLLWLSQSILSVKLENIRIGNSLNILVSPKSKTLCTSQSKPRPQIWVGISFNSDKCPTMRGRK